MRLIDADALLDELEELFKMRDDLSKGGLSEAMEMVHSMLTVDAVSRGLFDQIKRERDLAIAQLEQIGCQLGQRMDDIVKVIRCKDCKYSEKEPAREDVMYCKKVGIEFTDPEGYCNSAMRKEEG